MLPSFPNTLFSGFFPLENFEMSPFSYIINAREYSMYLAFEKILNDTVEAEKVTGWE